MIPSTLDNSLGFNIYRVSLLLRREMMKTLSQYQMTPEQWQVMLTLWESGRPVNQVDIVGLTLKDKPSVSRMIQRLEKNGWVEKTFSPKDGRATLIQPTEKGHLLRKEIPRKLKSRLDRALKPIPKEEQKEIVSMLKRMRYILE